MKKKEETFFLFLLFIEMRVKSESRNVLEEDLDGMWKGRSSRMYEIFQNNFSFFYS
jgi:hypothetical protein